MDKSDFPREYRITLMGRLSYLIFTGLLIWIGYMSVNPLRLMVLREHSFLMILCPPFSLSAMISAVTLPYTISQLFRRSPRFIFTAENLFYDGFMKKKKIRWIDIDNTYVFSFKGHARLVVNLKDGLSPTKEGLDVAGLNYKQLEQDAQECIKSCSCPVHG